MLSLKRTHILTTATTLSCCLITLSLAADSLPSHARSATQMTAAANVFIATLEQSQRESALFPLHIDERATWSNLPIIMVQPDGLLVGDMNDDQRSALHDLLRASMSSQGYAKISSIMRLDDILYDIESARIENDPEWRNNPRRREFVNTRSSGNYAVAVFGEPGDGDWGWKLAGHHGATRLPLCRVASLHCLGPPIHCHPTREAQPR